MSFCTNRQNFPLMSTLIKKQQFLFFHNCGSKKAEKMSYTRSYPHCPQKNNKKTNVLQEKQRTNVL